MLVSRWILAGAVASIILLASMTGLVYLQLSSQIGAQQSEIDRLNDMLGQYNATTYPAGSVTCSPAPDPSLPTMNLSQMSNGIQLTALLNATTIGSGQTVQVIIDALNTLPQTLKVLTRFSFPVYGMDSFASGFYDFPIGMALYDGYFTCSNVSSAQPLSIHLEPIYLGGSCPLGGCTFLQHVVFQPNSENASATWGSTPPEWDMQSMHLVATVSTYYTIVTPNGTFPIPYPGPMRYPESGVFLNGVPWNESLQNLEPGTYTLAAGTEWGQLVLLHFTVQSNGPDGVIMPVPQTYFGYDGSKGYTLSLLDSAYVSWYQNDTVERTVTGVGIGVGIYINETDVNSNVTISFYVSGSLVSTEDFSLSEIAGGAHPPTQLKIYGSLGFSVGMELVAGTNVTFGIHADGPVYVAAYSSGQALDGFVSSGTLGTTVPAPMASLGFELMAWGER